MCQGVDHFETYGQSGTEDIVESRPEPEWKGIANHN